MTTRTSIMAAVATRLQTITVAAGYHAVAVHPAGELVRYPDPWPTAQRWYLISASPGTGVWRCLAQRPVG